MADSQTIHTVETGTVISVPVAKRTAERVFDPVHHRELSVDVEAWQIRFLAADNPITSRIRHKIEIAPGLYAIPSVPLDATNQQHGVPALPHAQATRIENLERELEHHRKQADKYATDRAELERRAAAAGMKPDPEFLEAEILTTNEPAYDPVAHAERIREASLSTSSVSTSETPTSDAH